MSLSFPADWRVEFLDKVATIHSGLALGKSGLKDPVLLPYLRVANVQEGYLDLTEIKYVAVERHQIERFRLQKGDVLMTEGGDFDKLGRGDLWREELEVCLHQNHIFVVRPSRDLVLPEFLNYQSNSAYGRSFFLSSAKSSTTLASINIKQLRKFPLGFPSLAEQHRICEILAPWESTFANVQKDLQNRKKQLLGFRQHFLEGAANDDRTWVTLEQIVQVCPDRVSKVLPPEFRYITLSDVNAGVINPRLACISRQDAPKRARRAVLEGDILMSMVRPNLLGYARIDASHADCIASTGFALLRAKAGVDPAYVYHNLFCSPLQRQIQALVTGSSYPSISLDDIGSLRLALPDLATQQRIVAILDAAERGVVLARRQRDVVLQEKKFWTQKMVTGAWRITEFNPLLTRSSKMARPEG